MDPGAHRIIPSVRRATVEDARAVATVHTLTWQKAYAGLMPEQFLRELSVDERAARWQRILGATGTESRGGTVGGTVHKATWVTTFDGRVEGFCSLGPSRDDDRRALEAEVYALYVSPTHWRSGAGRALMSTAEAHARHGAAPAVTLWVLRDNPRARRFYEASGYSLDGGARDEAVGGVLLGHVRYRKAL